LWIRRGIHRWRISYALRMPRAAGLFRGSNGLGFQLIGALHPRLRTADLPRQTLNKRGQNIEVRVGRPVAAKAVKSFASEREATEYLRFRTFLLAGRGDAPPVPKKRLRPLAPATLAELIAAETGCLAPVCENEDFAVYLARADEIPNTLREIGRLRELTFRGAGEERHSTWTASISHDNFTALHRSATDRALLLNKNISLSKCLNARRRPREENFAAFSVERR
jgi:hypothetical protein